MKIFNVLKELWCFCNHQKYQYLTGGFEYVSGGTDFYTNKMKWPVVRCSKCGAKMLENGGPF